MFVSNNYHDTWYGTNKALPLGVMAFKGNVTQTRGYYADNNTTLGSFGNISNQTFNYHIKTSLNVKISYQDLIYTHFCVKIKISKAGDRRYEMNIGEKIKKLRTEKLMTQSELAGSEITRNMLSRIENGAALPSLGTIQYIAKRLNVSVGYLMADEKDELIYFKHNEIDNIKKAYMAGDFKICRDMCYNARSCDDDEVKLVLSECLLELGIEEFNSGRLRNACSYFDEAIESCSATVYNTCYIVAVAGVYFKYMKKLSSTLESYVLDTEKINIYPALSNEFCIYAIYNDKDIDSSIIISTEFLNPQ